MRTKSVCWIASGIIATIVVLAGCGDGSADASGDVDFGATLAEHAAKYAAACNAGDADAYCALLDESFTQLPPGAPPFIGKAAVRDAIGGFFEAYDLEDFTIETQTYEVSREFAWNWGTYSYRTAPMGTTDFAPYEGKYLSVLKKQPDGTWLFYIDCFNSNTH